MSDNTTLSTLEVNKALALLCGWQYFTDPLGRKGSGEKAWQKQSGIGAGRTKDPPNYCNEPFRIAELERKLLKAGLEIHLCFSTDGYLATLNTEKGTFEGQGKTLEEAKARMCLAWKGKP